MTLNSCPVNLDKMNMKIYVLIDIKREMKEDFVFEMKPKTRTLNVHPKEIHSRFFKLLKGAKHPLGPFKSDKCCF